MSKYLLIDFTANWCGPCKVQKTIIEDLKKMDDLFDVTVVDVDENQHIANKYNITVIPTIIIKKDQKELLRYTGITEKEIILKDINNIEKSNFNI